MISSWIDNNRSDESGIISTTIGSYSCFALYLYGESKRRNYLQALQKANQRQGKACRAYLSLPVLQKAM